MSSSVVFQPADDWSYTTFVVAVPSEFGASINFETDAVTWDSPDEVERRPLHAGFAAAWPYLELIAGAHGIDDPLDERVVEAYWVGNELLRLPPGALLRSAEERFRSRLP